jgi:hypothetical protein
MRKNEIQKRNQTMAEAFYRMIENLDGERRIKVIPYPIAQKLKMLILIYLIKG